MDREILIEPTEKEMAKLRAVADYLFDKGVGRVLFPDGVLILKSKGRIRQVWLGGEPLCAIRASDGFIVLNKEGAKRVQAALRPPRLRVTANEDAVPFVPKGRSLFAKHVVAADPEIRPAEEVLVVDRDDRLLASGKAVLSGEEMVAFNIGKAVEIRRGMSDVPEEV